ncbi:hypothetical protein P152DRAFT_458541 [Eremomyces bilateralis CBS 781.70]|uniref:Anaphase-promoting complex subunit 2 n=1 Tax=Eremomyces bilateralis CBS 781.70 TaxID=1392243 RepID=A0A6G1G3U0_9PEZI|nr:uncharacterized protein P152DRAFT_458541 [Eremomyces bilateralis CBS 781.70]KAF1812723.1 hypothetical protein P152DRAFT_458541 [Eremomyces bilateralis CBS 781.70]
MAALHESPLSRESLIFSSVFSLSAATHTTPTPLSTPDLGSIEPGQSFGGVFGSNQPSQQQSAAQRQVRRNLAWSSATRFLGQFALEDAMKGRPTELRGMPSDVRDAMEFLLMGGGCPLPESNEESLVDWYTNEALRRFVVDISPELTTKWRADFDEHSTWHILIYTTSKLVQAHRHLAQPLKDILLPIISRPSRRADDAIEALTTLPIISRFNRELRAAFVQAVDAGRFAEYLEHLLVDTGRKLFSIEGRGNENGEGPELSREEKQKIRERLTTLLRGIGSIGLGGDKSTWVVGAAMAKLLDNFVDSRHMKVDWYTRNSVVRTLKHWVKEGYMRYFQEIMACLEVESESGPQPSSIPPASLQRCQEIAINRLGRARVADLFDFIVRWDGSLGAIRDLKEYITLPGARVHLTHSFSRQLSRRLLHAGATTSDILDVYVYIIKAFNELDPKGVLLDRVARPIRRYLKDRDDTARIIVVSLLKDVDEIIADEKTGRLDIGGNVSKQIALEMKYPSAHALQEQDYDLDWGNMDWTPDPIDAEPEYKRSKSSDVIASLLTLYDREDFITELKDILGEYLLKYEDSDFEKEQRLVELFKVRLGEDKMQACEVMLHDVLESKRINRDINASINRENVRLGSELNAQILSSYFWPPLREDAFRVPQPVHALQQRYAAGFEGIKDMRRLQWYPALGQVEVELQLQDREWRGDCHPWQASVVYAFDESISSISGLENDPGRSTTPSRTVEELKIMLQMDEQLVCNALQFWTAHRVLVEVSPGIYEVQETLPADGGSSGDKAGGSGKSASRTAPPLHTETGAHVSAVKSQEDRLMENVDIYRHFIVGMLTNQGAMPVAKILMMLKMTMPGGFPFGMEEVRTLLGRLVEERKVVGQGDIYSVSKG